MATSYSCGAAIIQSALSLAARAEQAWLNYALAILSKAIASPVIGRVRRTRDNDGRPDAAVAFKLPPLVFLS